MIVRDLWTTIRRRWYLALASLLVTVGLCLTAGALVPATYQAEASVILLPPQTSVDTGGNPYLQLTGLRLVVDVMIRALNSQAAADSIQQAAPGALVEVAPDATTDGPVLVVTATNKTPESTMSTLNFVLSTIPTTLANFQSAGGVAQASQVTSSLLTSDTHPETIRKAQARAVIVAAVLGILLTVFIIGLIDSRAMKRRGDQLVFDTGDLTESEWIRQSGTQTGRVKKSRKQNARLPERLEQIPGVNSGPAPRPNGRHAVPRSRSAELEVPAEARPDEADAAPLPGVRPVALNGSGPSVEHQLLLPEGQLPTTRQ